MDDQKQINPHTQSKKQVGGDSKSIYFERNDYFQTNLYQRQWLSSQNKLKNIPSNQELLQKMDSNQYEKMIHKDNHFVTTNRASFKALDTKITKQPVFNDKLKVSKLQQSCDTSVFKSIYQVDFYKQKDRKQKSQPLQLNTRVRFQDQVSNENSKPKLQVSKSLNPKQFTQKTIYQVSYKERALSFSSSESSDSEYEQVKNKKNIQNQQNTDQFKKKQSTNRKKRGILINPNNTNILEKLLNKNRQ